MNHPSLYDIVDINSKHGCWEDPLIISPYVSLLPPEDSISMVADAFENDDFWYSTSRDNTILSPNTMKTEPSLTAVTAHEPGLDRKIALFHPVHQNQNSYYPTTIKHSAMLFPNMIGTIERVKSHQMVELLPEKQSRTCATGTDSLCRHTTKKHSGNKSLLKTNTNLLTEQPCIAQPLTSYNFFFMYDKERILGNTDKKDGIWDCNHYRDDETWNNNQYKMAFQQELLRKHWNRDRSIKRKHRKTNYLIPFQTLTRQISKNWHSLPVHVKAVFHEIAAKDFHRYQLELGKSHSTRHFQPSVDSSSDSAQPWIFFHGHWIRVKDFTKKRTLGCNLRVFLLSRVIHTYE